MVPSHFLQVLYVYIRICLMTSAQHNVRTTEGRFAASMFPGRRIRRLSAVHARHIGMLFFTTLNVGKEVVCKFAGFFGLDGESAGGNREQGNPWLPRKILNLQYATCSQNLKRDDRTSGSLSMDIPAMTPMKFNLRWYMAMLL